MKKIVVGTVIAAVGIAIFIMMSDNGIPVTAASVTEGSISSYVEERAVTSLPVVYKINMPMDGTIKAISITAGTKVAKGQTVAELDLADLESEKAAREAALQEIESSIALNRYNDIENTALTESADWIKTMQDTVAASQKKADASNARYLFAKWYLDSAEKMKSAISTKEFNQAEMEAAEAKVNYDADVLQSSAIKTIQSIFKLAPTYIQQFLIMKKLKGDMLDAQKKSAVAALKKAERDLERAILKSPVEGIVLKRYYENETALDAGTRLLDIGRLEELEVTADILSFDVERIKPGDPVDISSSMTKGGDVSGKVVRIKPEGFTKKSSLGVEEQRVEVTISFDKEALESLNACGCKLGVGYRLYVRIHTAAAAKALKIPRTALFKGDDGKWKVFKIVGGKAKLSDVTVGLENDNEVQIISGLQKGESVIDAPPSSLTDGASVSSGK